ncbi:hypothetical protein GCM10007092_03070 [Thermus composti]|nr:hypothetical protein GCM10007092_03070 [Thermus composti]
MAEVEGQGAFHPFPPGHDLVPPAPVDVEVQEAREDVGTVHGGFLQGFYAAFKKEAAPEEALWREDPSFKQARLPPCGPPG